MIEFKVENVHKSKKFQTFQEASMMILVSTICQMDHFMILMAISLIKMVMMNLAVITMKIVIIYQEKKINIYWKKSMI